MKIALIALLALVLSACTGIDTAATVESGLLRARGVANALLERKTQAELELMRETNELARIAREEANRLERAKCHAGLPALRAYAEASEEQREAVLRDCRLAVTPGLSVAE